MSKTNTAYKNHQASESEIKAPLKSINNRRCLTECNPANTIYFHPIILTGVVDPMYNTCGIDPVYDIKGDEMKYTDACRLEDNSKFELPTELSAIFMNFDFHYRDFLANMYGLHSFDQVIFWTMENDYLPFDTIKRVHNCAWKAYGNKIENLSDKVFEYYYDLIKRFWIKDYYKILSKKFSFHVTNDNRIRVTKVKPGTNTSTDDRLYEMIVFYYFNYSYFIRVLKKYLKTYQAVWDDVDSHYGNLKKFCFKYLVANVKKAVKD
jgi:hypothetical protein